MAGPALPIDLPAGSRIAVAGGCGGIGRVLVSALLDRACEVAVVDMPPSLAAHPPPGDVISIPADATSAAQVEAAARAMQSHWNGLDGFVNLCGYAPPRVAIDAYDPDTWRAAIDVNLNAAFLLSRAFMPWLKAGTRPALVHAASSLAVRAAPGYGPYAAAKAGILALTRTLAEENAPTVRVNAVAPSAVRTEFIAGGTGRAGGSGTPLLDLDAYGNALPLGRVAEADDVVGPILFLLGPGSAYMTGQVLHINGGLWQP